MSCCPDYFWADGYIPQVVWDGSHNVTNVLKHWKIEWTSPTGDRGGWFLYSTKWNDGDQPLTVAIGTDPYEHAKEQPWLSDVVRLVRLAAGICAGEVDYTATRVYPVPATFPTSPP